MQRSFIYLGLSFALTTSAYSAGQKCPEEARLRSIRWDAPTTMTFVNNTADPLRTYWLDYQGKRKFYAEIPAGQSYVQRTYVTHPWVVTNHDDDCLGVYMPARSARRIALGGEAQAQSTAPKQTPDGPATPAPVRTPANVGDEGAVFNVLDQVEYDPQIGTIRLFGHFDPKYPIAGIPYGNYLATLVSNPSPEFSLNWTQDSERRVLDLRRRLELDEEWRRLAQQWAVWVDESGRVTSAGRYFLPKFGIKSPAHVGNKAVALTELLSGIFEATGNSRAASTLEAYAKIVGQSNVDYRQFFADSGITSEANAIITAKQQGRLSERQAQVQLGALILQSLDQAVGLASEPTRRTFENAMRQGQSVDAALHVAINAFFDQLWPVYHREMTKLWSSVPELQVPVSLVDPNLRDAVNVEPEYRGMDRKSLLAKLMFSADYVAKKLGNIPELTDRIPGYRTEYAFRRMHRASRSSRTFSSRLWISVDRIDAFRSRDGNVLELREPKMRINIRELGSNGRDLPNQQPGEYGRLLTSLYDSFAQTYSPIFHELREAAKLSYAAKWLKARNKNLTLATAQGTWNGPARVPGVIIIAWSPSQSQDVQTTDVIGGIRIDVPLPGTPVCVTCPENIPASANVKPEEGMPDSGGLSSFAQSVRLVDAFIRLSSAFTTGPIAAQGPLIKKQLPSVACLAAMAAGVPGLGTLNAPPPAPQPLNDPNTRAIALLNSAFDGSGQFDADCDVKLGNASADQRQRAEAAKLAVKEALRTKAKELSAAAETARKEFDDVNREYQKAGDCVKKAAANQRHLHEPDQFMRRTTAEFLEDVQRAGQDVTTCGNQVVALAPAAFKAKKKLEATCTALRVVVELGEQVVSDQQQKTCKTE